VVDRGVAGGADDPDAPGEVVRLLIVVGRPLPAVDLECLPAAPLALGVPSLVSLTQSLQELVSVDRLALVILHIAASAIGEDHEPRAAVFLLSPAKNSPALVAADGVLVQLHERLRAGRTGETAPLGNCDLRLATQGAGHRSRFPLDGLKATPQFVLVGILSNEVWSRRHADERGNRPPANGGTHRNLLRGTRVGGNGARGGSKERTLGGMCGGRVLTMCCKTSAICCTRLRCYPPCFFGEC
jgi:hypothetical protein